MKWWVGILVILLVVILFGLEHKEEFYVNYVIDGDTFVSGDTKIRIWGIDAPEHNEDGYEASKRFMTDLITDKILRCILIDVDKYDRQVMRCYINDNDIARSSVSKGHSKDYEYYSNGYYAN